MNKSYRPMPGSVPDRAIAHMKNFAPGTEKSSSELAVAISTTTMGLGQSLAPAVRAGLLDRRMGATSAFWRLGDVNYGPLAGGQAALRDPDQSVVQSSINAYPSIFAYAESRAAAPFSVALSTDGRLTIERYGRTICELTNGERQVLLQAAESGVTP